MKRVYALLFNLTLLSSYSVANPSKVDDKYKSNNDSASLSQHTTKKISYTIKSGDTLLAIARKYYTTRDDIRKLNGLKKGATLSIGRVLTIPINTFYPKNRVGDYISLEGDTFKSVAKKFNISENRLFLMNTIDSKTLSKGIVLKVPKIKKVIKKNIERKNSKLSLTIASVVKDGEAKEKAERLRLAIAQREAEEETILAKAEEIKKARERREEGLRKAKEAKKKAEREKQKRLARIREATLEKDRLAKIEAEETKKLIEAQKEAQKAIDIAKKRREEQKRLELAQREAEEKAKVARERVKELEKAVKARAEKVKKKEEEIDKIKGIKESSLQVEKFESIAKKERVRVQKVVKDKKIAKKREKLKIISIKKSKNRDPSILTTQKSKIVDYKVKKGDNLYKIAKSHHTTTKEVLESNNFRSNSDLVIGKMIKVPVDTYFHLKDYTIQKGDTLYKIARKHNTTTTRVLLANNMRRGAKLTKGKIIKVPVDTFSLERDIKIASNGIKIDKKKKFKKIVVSKKLLHHKVKRGDTIYSIAKKNNITVKSLKLANSLKSNRDLKIGQNLTLPLNKNRTQIKLAKKSSKSKKVKSSKKSKNRIVLNARTGRSLDNLMRSLSSSNKRNALPQIARQHLGKRYVWGATGPYKFDCSGFTSYVCRKNGLSIPRTSINQSKVGKYISRSNLQAGDLIFFDTSKRRKGYVNHVGIYLGNNKFIHASSSKKRVVVTSLNKPFYKSRFKWGRRM